MAWLLAIDSLPRHRMVLNKLIEGDECIGCRMTWRALHCLHPSLQHQKTGERIVYVTLRDGQAG